MLVFTRRPNESIIIQNRIKITVISTGPGRVKLGIEAPHGVRVDRQEIHDKLEQTAAADTADATIAVTEAPALAATGKRPSLREAAARGSLPRKPR
jgi:carbon storage regulator